MNRTGTHSKLSLLLAFGLILTPQLLLAFGQNGHRVVGQIAENHLSPAALAAVDNLLEGSSLAIVSTWADEMRSSPEPFWQEQVGSTWHYINTEKGKSYRESKKNPKGDAYEASHRFMAILADTGASKQERATALRWLVHLVGDIHQPMHNAYAEDRGGNRVRVKWFGDNTNLHAVWDTHLIESLNLSYTELSNWLDTDDPELIEKLQDSNVMDWIDESIVYRDQIYKLGNSDYGYGYIYTYMPVAKERLLQAGIRLAGVLNRILDPGK